MNFGPLAERLRRSTVRVGSGSGIVWGADGLIVTNAHVARGRRAEIELWDGRRLDGEVTARNASADLAALRVSARDLPAAVPGDSSLLRAGELVLAVGNPLGFSGALSTGVVHGVGPVPGLGWRDWVQAGVRLAPGNSGGPLADAQGRVVGVNTAIAWDSPCRATPSRPSCAAARRRRRRHGTAVGSTRHVGAGSGRRRRGADHTRGLALR